MNFNFWDNQGRLLPHMRNTVCNAIRTPDTENYDGVISEVFATSQSQQYLFAKDVLFHDVSAFSQFISEMLKQSGGNHFFDDQECAYFLGHLFHVRGYRSEVSIEPINDAIVSILDGYTGGRNIFTAKGFSELAGVADTFKLESVDAAILRYFQRIKEVDLDDLLSKKVEDLFVGFHLPMSLKFWTTELSQREQSSYAHQCRTQKFIEFLSGQDAIDTVYINQLVETLGLENLLSHFDAIMDGRSLAHELLLLCKIHGEGNVLTDERLNKWQRKVNYGQATKTLSMLASTRIDWTKNPKLLEFVIKNMQFYHQDFIGFFPDDSLLDGAITHILEQEFARAVLMMTVDSHLPNSEVVKLELSTLLEGIIYNAQGDVAPIFKEWNRGYLALIGKALSAKGAEHMPDYINQLSAPGRQFFFGFLTHEQTNKQALFERFPDAKRATLTNDLGM
jgi:hypothetical protein